ncbi:hypothetical protein ILUMI_04643 [Ignelater luminosus]|uniref:Peptidase aspartic putative domain-containing protein n=1 Tax=Ignelater luminosus TaxID=2038154 RepID=A0A8K0GIU9_IGNLU|nr:hypothetical protein ILUMI_04643 [Ignelater luminosus]
MNIEEMEEELARIKTGTAEGADDIEIKNIRALDSLVNEEDQRNAFLMYLINSKLDPTTTREFENKNDFDKFPSYEELISFMEKKASLLETIDQRNQKSHAERLTAKAFVSTAISCPLCKGSHSLNSCKRFKQFGLKERSEKAKELKVCYNCLAKGHFTGKCKSRFNCQRCKSRHHTLLHQVESVASVSSAEAEQATVNLSAFGSNQTTVLLSNALVRILDSDGNSHPARALLDSGSMSNFISESLCKRLQLSRFPVDLQIRGINSAATSIDSRCNVEIISSNSQFQMKSSCLVIPHITGNIPEAKVDIIRWDLPANIHLADKKFNMPGSGKPILQKTRFGWLVSGNFQSMSRPFSALFCNHSQTLQISEQLSKFWEIEEIPEARALSREEILLDIHPNVLKFGVDEHAKTLGLAWSFKEDNFLYSIKPPSNVKITKRSILSETSQIFDPLGFLSPCTIMAKILLQQLWLEKVSWDESLSQGLHSKWLSFHSELVHLNDIKIPRHVVCNNPRRIELHGFADASTFTYGGCLYIRSTNKKNQVFTRLLCSKTRVAPLKTITIPRLELSAALILARLASQVMKAIQINFSKCVLWSDSTVTLGWLKTPSNLLKTFVANRVAEIQEVTERAT